MGNRIDYGDIDIDDDFLLKTPTCCETYVLSGRGGDGESFSAREGIDVLAVEMQELLENYATRFN